MYFLRKAGEMEDVGVEEELRQVKDKWKVVISHDVEWPYEKYIFFTH